MSKDIIRIYFYKALRPGIAAVYSRGVQIITKSKYSHCEILFSDGMSASASFTDGGVRFKQIDYDPEHWDYIELPADLFEKNARDWFKKHAGKKYDLLGNVHFVFSVVGDDKARWFCSEAIGAALGLPNPWRFDPGSLYQVIAFMAETLQKQERMNLPTTAWATA